MQIIPSSPEASSAKAVELTSENDADKKGGDAFVEALAELKVQQESADLGPVEQKTDTPRTPAKAEDVSFRQDTAEPLDEPEINASKGSVVDQPKSVDAETLPGEIKPETNSDLKVNAAADAPMIAIKSDNQGRLTSEEEFSIVNVSETSVTSKNAIKPDHPTPVKVAVDGTAETVQHSKMSPHSSISADSSASLNMTADVSAQNVPKSALTGQPITNGSGTSQSLITTVNHTVDQFQSIVNEPEIKLKLDIKAAGQIGQMISTLLQKDGDQQNRVHIQLDPPELGRLALDFKFDPQGLQQIVIASETPEALKRMREQHFELVQALKDNGLGESTVSYQQNDSRGSSYPYTQNEYHLEIDADDVALSAPEITQIYRLNPQAFFSESAGINIKL